MKSDDILMLIAFAALGFAGYQFFKKSSAANAGSTSAAASSMAPSIGADQSVYTGTATGFGPNDPMAISSAISADAQAIASQMGYNLQSYTAFHL